MIVALLVELAYWAGAFILGIYAVLFIGLAIAAPFVWLGQVCKAMITGKVGDL